MKAKLTPWFPADVKPVREGVYQRLVLKSGFGYWRWTGQFWAFGGDNSPERCLGTTRKSSDQSLPWRGLASDPSKEPA